MTVHMAVVSVGDRLAAQSAGEPNCREQDHEMAVAQKPTEGRRERMAPFQEAVLRGARPVTAKLHEFSIETRHLRARTSGYTASLMIEAGQVPVTAPADVRFRPEAALGRPSFPHAVHPLTPRFVARRWRGERLSRMMANSVFEISDMKISLRNNQNRVRDGWKAFFFMLAAVACFVVVGVVGRQMPQAFKPFAPSAILIAALGIAITVAAARMESSTAASLGLKFDARFVRHFAVGTLMGAGLIAAAAVAVCTLAGVQLSVGTAPAPQMERKLAIMFLGGAIFEELLFRGYAFQRAARGLGVWPAIALFGALFCVGHLPGNLDVGAPLLSVAMASLFASTVLQSLLYLRTGSLAVPMGVHFGWNFLQESLGFGVSGVSSPHAWFRVDLGNHATWMTGGDFGLEASALALMVLMLAIGALSFLRRVGQVHQSPIPG